MQAKTVRVTDKGQISIPVKMREAAGIETGDNLLLVAKDGRIVMKKVEEKDFSDLLRLSESVAKKIWDNKKDERWNNL